MDLRLQHKDAKINRTDAEIDVLDSRIRFLEAILKRITKVPIPQRNPDGVDQAAWTMKLLAKEGLEYPKDM